jgi:hypothetical protein
MRRLHLLLAALTVIAGGCAFTSTAKDWSGLTGSDGQPTYYTSTMKVGIKLLCFIPFLGDMGISGLTADLTDNIAHAGGSNVRIVQGTSEAYFYGFPPFTWVVTPVISTVAAEYKPDPTTYAKDQLAIVEKNKKSNWYKPWSW